MLGRREYFLIISNLTEKKIILYIMGERERVHIEMHDAYTLLSWSIHVSMTS